MVICMTAYNVFNLTRQIGWIVFLSAGSTSSSTSDHWLVRLTGGSKRGSLGSGGSISGAPVPTPAPESPELPVFGDEPSKTTETS